MKQIIFASLFFSAALFISACKDNQVETSLPESAKRIDSEKNAQVKKIIEANLTKSTAASNARTYGNATWSFTSYGYQYTGSVSQYQFPASVHVNNGNNFPIIIVISGQLDIINEYLSCSGSGTTCMVDDNSSYTNSNGYSGGKRIILDAGMSATLDFTAKIKGTGVEGWLSIEQSAPSVVAANWTDDYLYLIRGSL